MGGSLVASPLGEVVASAGAQPQLVLADIDVDGSCFGGPCGFVTRPILPYQAEQSPSGC
ncbi:hypothetical protein MAHJHV63_49770 [Mycobacterium avium subsp. hominissuis]